MNITPKIKSMKNRNNLVVNVSIQFPMKQKCPISYRSQQSSISPSPNKHKKKFKLIITPNYEKKTMNSSNLNTLRDLQTLQLQHPPSRKKSIKPTEPNINSNQIKSVIQKFKSCQLSPRKKNQTSRKSKQGSKIVRNISILDQVVNDQDNIIKYTSNSNQIRDKYEDFLMNRSCTQKVETNISQVDIFEIRRIQNLSKTNKEKQKINKINDLLKNSCAKRIQRAWRNYKTKKLIKSYSNDIRSKYLKNIKSLEQPPLSSRSMGFGLKMKKKLLSEFQIQKTQREGYRELATARDASQLVKTDKIVKKIQEDNMQKWQIFLQQIKNKKNLSKALQFSLQRSQELKKQLKKQFFASQSQESNNKIIKTKKYYEQQRQKWRQVIQKSNSTIKRQQRIHYFENEMLKLQNDYLENSDNKPIINNIQNSKQLQQFENQKLRKKLQLFKNHLPNIQQFQLQPQRTKQQNQVLHKESKSEIRNTRLDINDLVKKKYEVIGNKIEKQVDKVMQQQPNKQSNKDSQQSLINIHYDQIQEQQIRIQSQQKSQIELNLYNPDISKDIKIKEKYRSQAQRIVANKQIELRKAGDSILQKSNGQTKLKLTINSEQNVEWILRLKSNLKQTQKQLLHIILDQLILQSLIEISQSETLITFIKGIYDKKNVKKPEGIVTNQSSIKDYLNYFVNFLYQNQLEHKLMANLMKPIGPSALDVLKYFRGDDIVYDPDSQYVMSIKIFNLHWQYANQLIYFDPKWQNEKKQAQRVGYLKQLTKIFFRVIFDGFNQSLQQSRLYGLKGKPYPWSCSQKKFDVPDLKKSITKAYERVMKYSVTYAGVLFADKHHSLNKNQVQQIQQQNLAKMLTIQIKEDEYMWNFFQDELVQLKLQLMSHIEAKIIAEVIKQLNDITIKNINRYV